MQHLRLAHLLLVGSVLIALGTAVPLAASEPLPPPVLLTDPPAATPTATPVIPTAMPSTPAPAPVAVPAVPARDILEVIQALKAKFLSIQKPDGSWDDPSWSFYPGIVAGGNTALICWALLQADQDPFSEPIHRAVGNLMSVSMAGTYNRSLRCMVLASLARIEPGSKYAKAMQGDVEFLLQSRLASGRWTYLNAAAVKSRDLSTPDAGAIGDNSNTQFAVLALREATVAGAVVPANIWREIRDYWQAEQNEDGGFGYRKGVVNSSEANPYGSMTAAGTASLFITEDMVRGAQCCKGELPEPILNALGWLSANFDAAVNPKRGPFFWMYWLYSAERVAETSGYRNFGDHDWFAEGSAAIVKAYRGNELATTGNLFDPAFALIFLSKSVAPLVCNKLDFGANWNPNPLDAAHMTRYLGAEVFERHLNWQILRLSSPISMYQEAPILLITTKKWPGPDDPLTGALKDNILEFCETGGTLLIDHTCTPDPDFHKNLSTFLERTWPGRKFRTVPANHPVYSAHFPLEQKIALQALGNGCREYVFVCDGAAPTASTQPVGSAPASQPADRLDLSCIWQKSLAKEQPAAFQMAANIYMYATDKSFRNKIQPRSNLPRTVDQASQSLPIARLQHANNWNACPLALPLLSGALQARSGLGLDVEAVKLSPTQLFGRKVLVISGQGKMDWTAEQIAVIRDYIKSGGCVLADSLMGDKDFTESLRRLAASALMAPLRPIPDNDPLITGKFADKAFNLTKVQFSRTLRWRKGVAGPVSLEGVQVDGRWAFLLSPYDLTNGLATAKPYGVLGYEPDDATRIAANCMLYAARKAGIAVPAAQ